MQTARIVVDRDFRVGEVDPRLYGSFIEHLGRAVYGGIYEPGHPTADEWASAGTCWSWCGARRADRPLSRRQLRLRLQLARRRRTGRGASTAARSGLEATETNEFGTNEFADWAQRAGTEVDDGGQPGHARYRRGPQPGRILQPSRRERTGAICRIAHGVAEPHDIKTWCLGNEMDGPWQIGHKTADEYGRLAAETAKVDAHGRPDASNSSPAAARTRRCRPSRNGRRPSSNTPTRTSTTSRSTPITARRTTTSAPSWRRSLQMDDYIQLGHRHLRLHPGQEAAQEAALPLLRRVERLVSRPRATASCMRDRPLAGRAAAAEEPYTLEDALVVGCMLITLLQARRPGQDRLHRPARQRHRPDQDGHRRRRLAADDLLPVPPRLPLRPGRRARPSGPLPTYSNREFDTVPLLDAVAVLDEEREELTIFAVNRGQDGPPARRRPARHHRLRRNRAHRARTCRLDRRQHHYPARHRRSSQARRRGDPGRQGRRHAAAALVECNQTGEGDALDRALNACTAPSPVGATQCVAPTGWASSHLRRRRW